MNNEPVQIWKIRPFLTLIHPPSAKNPPPLPRIYTSAPKEFCTVGVKWSTNCCGCGKQVVSQDEALHDRDKWANVFVRQADTASTLVAQTFCNPNRWDARPLLRGTSRKKCLSTYFWKCIKTTKYILECLNCTDTPNAWPKYLWVLCTFPSCITAQWPSHYKNHCGHSDQVAQAPCCDPVHIA